jgi:hypothetical protein
LTTTPTPSPTTEFTECPGFPPNVIPNNWYCCPDQLGAALTPEYCGVTGENYIPLSGIRLASVNLSSECFTTNERKFDIVFSYNPTCSDSFEYRTNGAYTGWMNVFSSVKTHCNNVSKTIFVPSGSTEACFRFYTDQYNYSNEICVPITPCEPRTTGVLPIICSTGDVRQIRVMYSDMDGPCPGGHFCGRANFDLYINDNNIGIVNLNNDGGSCDNGVPNFVDFPSMVNTGLNDRAVTFSISENSIYPVALEIGQTGYKINLECRPNCGEECGQWVWYGVVSGLGGPEPCQTWTEGTVVGSNPPLTCSDLETLCEQFYQPESCSIVTNGTYCYSGYNCCAQANAVYPYDDGYVPVGCHLGIAWIELLDIDNNILFSSCVPNDQISYIIADATSDLCNPCYSNVIEIDINLCDNLCYSNIVTQDLNDCLIYSSSGNGINFHQMANWNGSDLVGQPSGNLTSVGTNGNPSVYGTYDQGGNVWEWVDYRLDVLSAPSSVLEIGGAFDEMVTETPFETAEGTIYPTFSSQWYLVGFPPINNIFTQANNKGFRVASYTNPSGYANFVSVADTGNSPFGNNELFSPVGSVDYNYSINKYLVTNCDYVKFLNYIAKTNDEKALYNTNMGESVRGGIARSGSIRNYTYSTKLNMNNKPVTHVSFVDSIRYCNWLHNGMPTGLQNGTTTESGAYNFNPAAPSAAPSRNINAKYFIPNLDEWFKAAYYKGSGTNTGYWEYTTQSNVFPSAILADVSGNGPYIPTVPYNCDNS